MLSTTCLAQQSFPTDPAQQKPSDKQINVNWLYGSYVPKDVPLQSPSGHQRFELYIRQTYTTPGIYVKTLLFGVSDQINRREPEWGNGAGGFVKRLGDRQAQFIIQNSVIALGDGVLHWEPRYDRCDCDGFWPRARHAMVRNFVTYDRTERHLRPQIMPYLGAFGAAAVASQWEPGNPGWRARGYQAVVGQVFVGMGIDALGEFAPEIARLFHKKKGLSASP